MKTLRAAALSVAVGGRNPGDAPTLVLVHGLGGTWRNWIPVLPALTARLHVVAVDMPGFGDSPPLPGRSFHFPDVADHIADALDALGVTTHALAGHSTGGGVAGMYAARHGSRLDSLILVAPAGFVGDGLPRRVSRLHQGFHRTMLALRAPALPLLANRAIRRRAFSAAVHDVDSLTAADARELACGAQRGVSTPAARANVLQAGVHLQAATIATPTRLLWGTEDRIVSADGGPRLVRLLPHASLELYEQTGHLPMFEQPQAVASSLIEFVGEYAGRSTRGTSG